MNAILAIATNTLRQTIRQRLYFNIGIFGVGMVLLSMVMANITFGEPARVVRSIGLSGTAIAVDLIALLVSVALVHSEIDRKTLFIVLTRPVSRTEYVIGRYLGLVAALCLALAGFVVVFILVLLSQKQSELRMQDVVALLAILPEACVLGAFGMLLSTFSTPTLSAGLGLGFWLAAASADDLVRLTAKAEPFVQSGAKVVALVLPAFSRFNFRDAAIYDLAIPRVDLVAAGAYGVLWVVVLVAISAAVLSRREML
ncbi:MAG: ABC transporter permease subunit [Deltaproteobacteria bacterium]